MIIFVFYKKSINTELAADVFRHKLLFELWSEAGLLPTIPSLQATRPYPRPKQPHQASPCKVEVAVEEACFLFFCRFSTPSPPRVILQASL